MVSHGVKRRPICCLIGTLFSQFCLSLLLDYRLSAADEILSNTDLLAVDRPLDQIMVEGLNVFCMRELAESPRLRSERWRNDLSSPGALEKSLTDHRSRFQQLIGAVDVRLTLNPSETHDFELITTLQHSSILAKNDFVTVHRVRWSVLEGVSAEGLLLVPQTIRAAVVALPDADWTPEMFCGLLDELPQTALVVRRLAEAGCMVAVPMLLSRSDEFSGHTDIGWTNQPHREFIYRQAFEVGRHVIGYEVQKVLAAVDLLERHLKSVPANLDNSAPKIGDAGIGVLGFGEGGLLALYTAALDPRITACWVSGYFQQRESIWQEPIYRNVWGLLTEFGDAELAGMIAPRRLIIESCTSVNMSASSEKQEGRKAVAAPGTITTSSLNSVRTELDRANAFYLLYGKPEELISVVSGENGDGPSGTEKASLAFAQKLGVLKQLAPQASPWATNSLRDKDQTTDAQHEKTREKRQFDELQTHVQNPVASKSPVRDARWRLNPAAIDEWNSQLPAMREWVHKELIGQLPYRCGCRRGRIPGRVLQNEDYVGYEIMLDV
ncbi:MAG: hypothetical protein U0936_25005 [Planctomycetaceae bacterium]